jgi:hypothetical protein
MSALDNALHVLKLPVIRSGFCNIPVTSSITSLVHFPHFLTALWVTASGIKLIKLGASKGAAVLLCTLKISRIKPRWTCKEPRKSDQEDNLPSLLL